ncbi:MAG TPA: ribonuclease Z, partial [Spirochaetia bacterium]|nr:ribonuclease Z [Spirochaetia bacterium]
GRHLTSVLLRREGELFLFDCGEGTQVSIRSLNLKWKKISVIFISHTHADHITGLAGILMLSAQVERDDPLYIIGPPRIREFVEMNRQILEMYINYEIIVQEIENPSEPQIVYNGDGFRVRAFPLKHSRVCVGYTLEEDVRPGIFHPERAAELGVPRGPLWSQLQNGETVEADGGAVVTPAQVMGGERKGRKFSYVTDSLPIESIGPEVANSDLLICEGMFERELADSAHSKRHMTADDAGRIALNAGGVKKMGLIHYSPRYTERELKKLLHDAREHFPESFLTRDRQNIAIPYED